MIVFSWHPSHFGGVRIAAQNKQIEANILYLSDILSHLNSIYVPAALPLSSTAQIEIIPGRRDAGGKVLEEAPSDRIVKEHRRLIIAAGPTLICLPAATRRFASF